MKNIGNYYIETIMLSITNNWIKYFESAFLRMTIFAFLYLTLRFSQEYITVNVGTNPLMAICADVFFSMTVIIIFNYLYGKESIGHDINTLNFYGVLCHLLYMACYIYRYDVSALHNYAAKFLNGLIILRLFYFGNREVFAKIAIIEYAKRWRLDRRWFFNSYVNGMTIALFVFCAIPWFTLIYIINTDQIRVTGIAIVLLTFFIVIEKSDKKRRVNAVKNTTNSIKSGTTETVICTTSTLSADDVTITKQLVDAKTAMSIFKNGCVVLIVTLVAVLAVGSIVTSGREQMMFSLGYASGYTDGKTGAKPKSNTDFNKMMRCSFDDGLSRFGPRFDPICKK
jgi:hypothetical protein